MLHTMDEFQFFTDCCSFVTAWKAFFSFALISVVKSEVLYFIISLKCRLLSLGNVRLVHFTTSEVITYSCKFFNKLKFILSKLVVLLLEYCVIVLRVCVGSFISGCLMCYLCTLVCSTRGISVYVSYIILLL